jgi:hypothetical protein
MGARVGGHDEDLRESSKTAARKNVLYKVDKGTGKGKGGRCWGERERKPAHGMDHRKRPRGQRAPNNRAKSRKQRQMVLPHKITRQDKEEKIRRTASQ